MTRVFLTEFVETLVSEDLALQFVTEGLVG
jgi:hypothetical protein